MRSQILFKKKFTSKKVIELLRRLPKSPYLPPSSYIAPGKVEKNFSGFFHVTKAFKWKGLGKKVELWNVANYVEIVNIYMGNHSGTPFTPFFTLFHPWLEKNTEKSSKNDRFWLNCGRMAKNEKKVQIMKVAHHDSTDFSEKNSRKYTVNQPEMNRKWPKIDENNLKVM